MNEKEIENIAKICHEANKAYCKTIGDYSLNNWIDSPEWQKENMISAVRFYLSHPNCKPSDIHENWRIHKEKDGWKYGEIKNEKNKEHPYFLPYDNLDEKQKKKDKLFISIVKALI